MPGTQRASHGLLRQIVRPCLVVHPGDRARIVSMAARTLLYVCARLLHAYSVAMRALSISDTVRVCIFFRAGFRG